MADRLVTKAAQAGYAALQALAYVAEDRLPARLEDWGDLHEVEWEVWEGAAERALDGAGPEDLHRYLRANGAALAAPAGEDPTPTQRAAYDLFSAVARALHDAAVGLGAVEGAG